MYYWCEFYNDFICPILDYCSGVWGIKPHNDIEKVQFDAIRYFLGVHKFAPKDMLIGEVGWTSCFTRHQLALLILFNRLVGTPSTRLSNNIFLWDLNYSYLPGTWSFYARKLFYNLGLQDYFVNLTPCDPGQAFSNIKDIEFNSWNERRYQKPKLRYYNMHKPSLDAEDYLFFNIPKYHRSIFAQFRAGILPLNIEVEDLETYLLMSVSVLYARAMKWRMRYIFFFSARLWMSSEKTYSQVPYPLIKILEAWICWTSSISLSVPFRNQLSLFW